MLILGLKWPNQHLVPIFMQLLIKKMLMLPSVLFWKSHLHAVPSPIMDLMTFLQKEKEILNKTSQLAEWA